MSFFDASIKSVDDFFNKYRIGDLAKEIASKAGGIQCEDVLFLEDGIFILLPEKELLKGVVYKKIIKTKELESDGIPRYHIYHCDILKKDFETNKNIYVFSIPHKNSFDFTVKEGRVDVKIYYDKPLDICPSCLNRYNSLHGAKKGVKEFEYLKDFLFIPPIPPKDEALAIERYERYYSNYCEECRERGFIYHKKGEGLFIKSICKNCLKKDKGDD